MRIRPVRDDDTPEWLRMSQALDPSCPREEHEADLRLIRARSDAEVFVIERPEGGLAGYVEIASRSYADGCATSPVGYVEVSVDVTVTGVRKANPIRVSTMPRTTAMAATPKATTEVNSEACRNEESIATARLGSFWSSSA